MTSSFEPTPNNQLTHLSRDAATVAATAAIGSMALSSGGTVLNDLQMLSSVLSSSCMCGDIASRSQQLSYTVSPFVDLGNVFVVVGNIGVCCVVLLIHYFVVLLVTRRTHLHTPRGDIESHLRYPSVSIKYALFLAPGVLKASTGLLFALPEHRRTPDLAAAVLGLFLIAGLAAVL